MIATLLRLITIEMSVERLFSGIMNGIDIEPVEVDIDSISIGDFFRKVELKEHDSVYHDCTVTGIFYRERHGEKVMIVSMDYSYYTYSGVIFDDSDDDEYYNDEDESYDDYDIGDEMDIVEIGNINVDPGEEADIIASKGLMSIDLGSNVYVNADYYKFIK